MPCQIVIFPRELCCLLAFGTAFCNVLFPFIASFFLLVYFSYCTVPDSIVTTYARRAYSAMNHMLLVLRPPYCKRRKNLRSGDEAIATLYLVNSEYAGGRHWMYTAHSPLGEICRNLSWWYHIPLHVANAL